MARESKEARLARIHREALEEFDDIWAALRDERMAAVEDRRFYSVAGQQWDGPVGEQFANRARFEFNKVHLAVIRIFNEYRANRITVDFQPQDGDDNDMADTCDGLYRADEQRCSADEAYDNAFEEAVGGGVGAWRLRACYEDEDDDEDTRQRVVMEPIFDADTCVFFDLGAKRYDKADADRCYVLTPMPTKAYRKKYEDDPIAWPREAQPWLFDWTTADLTWICEHYRIEEDSELVRYFVGLDEEEMAVPQRDLDADPEKLDELLATGFREVREKRVKRRKVMKYLMSGGKMLTEGEEIAGRHIPIVPVYGKRWVVDGVERCMGHVRLAKDAQRLLNMLLSWLGEMAGRFDVEKPIFTPEQVAGHATMWARDNVDKFPYLLVNAMTDQNGQTMPPGPVAYTKAPNIPPAMAALAQIAEQALQDLLGNQQQGEKIQPNLSGKAVELIQNRLDMQVFIYMSNLAKSMKRCGEIWLSMMRDIAIEPERRMKTIGADGKASSVVLNRPVYDEETAREEVENDISKATFDVVVDVGPSSSSKRAATVRAVTGLMGMTQDPETLQALSMVALANIEGEGLSDVQEWARRRGVRLGIVKPTEEEKAELAQEAAGQQPDPQAQALLSMAEEASANAQAARAKTVQTVADADLKIAQRAKVMAEAMKTATDEQIASVTTLQQLLDGAMNQPGSA